MKWIRRLGVLTVSLLYRKRSDLASRWDTEGRSLLNSPFLACLNMCVSDTDSQTQTIIFKIRYFLKENLNIFFHFNMQMRNEEAKYFLEQGKGWPECVFPSLEYLWLQCGTALLDAVECIISFVSNSTPSQSFHNFTIVQNNLELTCYGTVGKVNSNHWVWQWAHSECILDECNG